MANVKTNQSNYDNKLSDWKNSATNRGDVLYFVSDELNEKDIPDHDILVAGFPCQAFSQAGKKLGFEDARGTLFFDVARIIKEKRPNAFLLENVKSLKTHDKGKTFKVITEILEELNYEVYTMLYKARDFGAPQNSCKRQAMETNGACAGKPF